MAVVVACVGDSVQDRGIFDVQMDDFVRSMSDGMGELIKTRIKRRKA